MSNLSAADRDTGLETVVALDDIVVGKRYRTDDGDLTDLVESISDIGLLQPIGLTPDYRLIFGGRRVAAYRVLGRTHIQARITEQFTDAIALLRAELDENTCRKAMTVSETVALGAALEELEKPKARERIREGGRTGGQASPASVDAGLATGRPARPNRVTNAVAGALDISTAQYERARGVHNAVNHWDPDVRTVAEANVAAMDRGKPISVAAKEVRDARKTAKARLRPVEPSPDHAAEPHATKGRSGKGRHPLRQLANIQDVVETYVDLIDRLTASIAGVSEPTLRTDEAVRQMDGLVKTAQALTRAANHFRKESLRDE